MAETPRLKVKYQTEIVPALVEQLGIKNVNLSLIHISEPTRPY